MKALREHIAASSNQSLVAYRHTVSRFPFLWHYHPEAELTYIVRGQGKRLVGDSFADFGPGDLVLLGQGLPHTWESQSEGADGVEAIVIQWLPEVWQPIFDLPEMEDVRKLLAKSSLGITFPDTEILIRELILALPTLEKPQQIASFLSILSGIEKLAGTPLASPLFKPLRGDAQRARVNAVCQYIHLHGYRQLPLAEIADQAHLTPTAFCKFFKRATGKTYSDYVNEVRIAKASLMLTEGELPIAEVADACGFESLTYFNRIFKLKKGFPPRELRRLAT